MPTLRAAYTFICRLSTDKATLHSIFIVSHLNAEDTSPNILSDRFLCEATGEIRVIPRSMMGGVVVPERLAGSSWAPAKTSRWRAVLEASPWGWKASSPESLRQVNCGGQERRDYDPTHHRWQCESSESASRRLRPKLLLTAKSYPATLTSDMQIHY